MASATVQGASAASPARGGEGGRSPLICLTPAEAAGPIGSSANALGTAVAFHTFMRACPPDTPEHEAAMRRIAR